MATLTYTYTLINLTAVVLGYTGNLGNLIIPSQTTFGGNTYNVVGIGNNVFSNALTLTAITLPDSITTLGTSAFNGCTNLITAILSNSINTLGNFVFNGCSGLTTITLPNSITTLGNSVFSGCTGLTNITLSELTTSLGNAVFLGCSILETITLPALITTLGNDIFVDCISLTELIWNNQHNLTTIGTTIFANTPLLSEVIYYRTNDFDDLSVASQNLQLQISSDPTYVYVPIPILCFKSNSKILTFNLTKNIEEYVMVQYLRIGDLVKVTTNWGEYKKIYNIKKSKIYNPGHSERIVDRLYVCNTYNFKDTLFEDLIITGAHSLLVPQLNNSYRTRIIKEYGVIFTTDGNYRLPAFIDDRTVPFSEEGNFDIYHFALENENVLSNYGVYANGLLVESVSIRQILQLQ